MKFRTADATILTGESIDNIRLYATWGIIDPERNPGRGAGFRLNRSEIAAIAMMRTLRNRSVTSQLTKQAAKYIGSLAWETIEQAAADDLYLVASTDDGIAPSFKPASGTTHSTTGHAELFVVVPARDIVGKINAAVAHFATAIAATN